MGLPIEVPRGLPMGSAFVVHPRYVPWFAFQLPSDSQLGGLWVEMTSSRAASAVQFGGTTAQGPNGAAPRRVRAINFLALVPLSASFYALDAPCISAHSANYKFLGVGDSPACSQYSAAPAARCVRSPTGPQQLHTACATSHSLTARARGASSCTLVHNLALIDYVRIAAHRWSRYTCATASITHASLPTEPNIR